MIHKLHIVQPVLLGSADCIAHIKRLVGVGTGQVNRHTLGKVGLSYVFCLMGDFLPALDELLLELCNQGFGALRVHRFERSLRVMRHRVSNHRHRRKNGKQYNE